MRLLNTKTFKLEEVPSKPPKYAILSHTWEEKQEVAFEEMGTPTANNKRGLRKIEIFCKQAAIDNYNFVWVDTCCIDKRSSSELSEAIDSMYEWYKHADRCYAYLSDVKDRDLTRRESQLRVSHWFTRGWTLQELVAPKHVDFFGEDDKGDWFFLGTKDDLRNDISNITKIDANILKCSEGIFKASIAQRMSWASGRKTTRPEDIAYCLLGIFNVKMPLLYGEGEKAFTRLQEKLLDVSSDHTILAWSFAGDGHVQRQLPPTTETLLAPSVEAFRDCAKIVRSREVSSSSHWMANIGLSITLPTVVDRSTGSREYYGFLDCYRRSSDKPNDDLERICLALRYIGHSQFYRVATAERTIWERHYSARMTPMFIARNRPDTLLYSMSRSAVTSETSSTDSTPSRPGKIGGVSWALRALHGLWPWDIWIKRELSNHENAPLLPSSVGNVLQDQSNFRHDQWSQKLRKVVQGWARWPLRTFQKVQTFLILNGTKLLIVFVPLGLLAGALPSDPTLVLVLNFLGIMALAPLLAFATKKLSSNVCFTLGQLINAVLGNAVEMIICIAALRIGQVDIIQWSIVGSITSYILLVLGCCFGVSGMLQLEQTLNFTAASTMLSLMAVALASLILPATLYTVLQKSAADTTDAILGLSRGVAIILLVLFCIYQYFQQKSPANFFHVEQPEEQGELQPAKMMDLKYLFAMIAFIFLITILIGMMSVCADNLVGSIDSVLQRTRITQGFIGFVFLPMVGSTAAPSKAVITAYNNRLDRAIDVVITNVMQITLFVMPSVVLLGWAIDQPMQLEFGFLETLCFFLSVFVVSLLVHDRKINYLGGAVCIAIYFMIALTMYFYPDD